MGLRVFDIYAQLYANELTAHILSFAPVRSQENVHI